MARPNRRSAGRKRSEKVTTGPSLRRLEDPLEERRFEPAASSRQYVGVILMSLGAIALGAGVYAIFIRPDDAPPIEWAPWVLAAGAVMLVSYFILGQAGQPNLRVGDLGIGIEEGDRVARTAWFQIQKIGFDKGILNVKPHGGAILVSLSAHGPAARLIVKEALRRIPERAELDEGDLAAIGEPADEGERVEAEPPQVTNMQCAASERTLTFERDVRMCARCGAFYHRAGVPARCVTCDQKLRRAA